MDRISRGHGRPDPIDVGGRRVSWKRSTAAAALAVMLPAVAVVGVSGTPSPAAAGPAPVLSDAADTGNPQVIAQLTGAQLLWNQGFTGAGVGVAVIDTGVAKVPGLDQAGKVVDGVDLSFDSQDPKLAYTDAYGHGTHMAGIIAGSDVKPGATAAGCTTCTGPSPYTDTTKFVGIAPGARIVNVKVGAYDGTVDVTQVIAGIDWVVQHRNDPGLNIRVINLSFGTDSLQAAQVDPLVYAVEQAWNAGIVVVAAGGNDGDAPGPLGNPAISPAIIAVGSIDAHNTLRTTDDSVAEFAQHGTKERPVDLAAPGVSVKSLAVPGSFVDQNVTTGKEGNGRFQRASGTSQSTAVVAGLAALLLSKFPTASPDGIKTLLTSTAVRLPLISGPSKYYVGSGLASLTTIASVATSIVNGLLRFLLPTRTPGVGTGSLEASRGTYHVVINGSPLVGEIDIFGRPWVSAAMAPPTKARATWTGGLWNGSLWSGDEWLGTQWERVDWTGLTDWTGAPWTGARWTGARWTGARWTSAGWDGARWTGARWTGARWTDAGWS